MATLPTRLVEIEFDTGVWTDVAADTVALQTRRGRNRESGAFETGQLILTLRNDTRKYDPDNAAGTYYGKLRPNRRVRLRATYSAVTYPVFVGYIDKISQVYGGPNDATAEIQVSDFFKILNRVELARSVYTAEVTADAPDIWYRLDEPSGSTVALNSGTLGAAWNGDYTANLYNSPPTGQLGQEGLIVRDGGTAIFNPGGGSNLGMPLGSVGLDSAEWAIEFWLKYTTLPTGGDTLLYASGPAPWPNDDGLSVTVVTGILGFAVYNTAGTIFGVISTTTLQEGVTYHVVLQHDATRQMRIWLNGAQAWGPDGATPTVTTGTIVVNAISLAGAGNGKNTMDEFAIYLNGLSSGRIVLHNSAGRTPWNGDDPGSRLARVFQLVGSGTYDLNTGLPTLQATSLGGSVLAYAQKVEETALGELFVSRDGTVTYRSWETLNTGAYLTSQATLVDDDSGAGIPYRAVSADVDEAIIVTRATVSREGSIAVTYQDAAAIAEFQLIDETHDGLFHNSETYSLSYAQWVVNTHKTPASRVGAVTLELPKDPVNMYPAILGLEIGQKVTYKRKPQNTGAVITQAMRVEAISHRTDGAHWTTTLQLSPFNLGAGGYPVGVWDVTNWDQSVWGL